MVSRQEKTLIKEKLKYGAGGRKTWGDVCDEATKGKGWHEDADPRTGKAPVHKEVAERAQAKHAQNTPMKKEEVLFYRIEDDNKYHLDADGSGRFGLPFSSYEKMRKAIKRKFKLKKVGTKRTD